MSDMNPHGSTRGDFQLVNLDSSVEQPVSKPLL